MIAIRKAEGKFSETEIDDEVVVMSLDSGDFFSLTGTARTIWQLLDGSRDRDALLKELAADHAAPEAQIAEDLDPFLDRLAQAGLILRG